MKIAWMTDLHFFEDKIAISFLKYINNLNCNIILIGGDISSSILDLPKYLEFIKQYINSRIYYVIGNHDCYGGTISHAYEICEKIKSDNFLRISDLIELNKNTCLIGDTCWADGRLGLGSKSTFKINDYNYIYDYYSNNNFSVMNKLGDQSAEYIKLKLQEAVNNYNNIIMLTHVPIFKKASRFNGKISEDNYIPHFSCKAVGDIVLSIMKENINKNLTVLSGHTHERWSGKITKNIYNYVGYAQYGFPLIERIFII